MKYRDCTIYVVKTKAPISCAITAQLNRAFVFAYAKSMFSHDVAQFSVCALLAFCLALLQFAIFNCLTKLYSRLLIGSLCS